MKLSLLSLSLCSLACAAVSPSASITGSLISTPSGTLQIAKPEQCACKKLVQSFGSGVILPGQNNYTQQTIDYYWDVRADLSPACVIVPKTAQEVAKSLKILKACNSQFAVRGGGHMNVRLYLY